jgi:hypothetical protein
MPHFEAWMDKGSQRLCGALLRGHAKTLRREDPGCFSGCENLALFSEVPACSDGTALKPHAWPGEGAGRANASITVDKHAAEVYK